MSLDSKHAVIVLVAGIWCLSIGFYCIYKAYQFWRRTEQIIAAATLEINTARRLMEERFKVFMSRNNLTSGEIHNVD